MALPAKEGRLTWSVLTEAWSCVRSRHLFWALVCLFVLVIDVGVDKLSSLGFRLAVGHAPGDFLSEMHRLEAALGHFALIALDSLTTPLTFSGIFMGLRSLRGQKVDFHDSSTSEEHIGSCSSWRWA